MTPEWAEDDAPVDWDEATASRDDRFWSYFAFEARFRWQHFLNWWVARRYVMPRDTRKR